METVQTDRHKLISVLKRILDLIELSKVWYMVKSVQETREEEKQETNIRLVGADFEKKVSKDL